MTVGLPGFLKQQTGQAIVVVGGLLYWFWREGAPMELLYILGANGFAYIVGEKWRAGVNGKSST